MNKLLSIGLNLLVPSIPIATTIAISKYNGNTKKYEMLIDNQVKTFNSKQEAIDYLIKKGDPKIERHVGEKHFKNNDGIVNYKEDLLAKYDVNNIKPAYTYKNGTHTWNRQNVIDDYLSKANIDPYYLDLAGNEYETENEAKQAILQNINEDIMDNLFYELQTSKGTKYYNALVESDIKRLVNDLTSEGAREGILKEANALNLQNNNGDKKLWIEHEENIIANVFDSLIAAYKKSLDKKIYRIELSLKHRWDSWEYWYYTDHYAKFGNYETLEGNDSWALSSDGMSLYKNVDYDWIQKYLLNRDYKTVIKKRDWNVITNLFTEELDEQEVNHPDNVGKRRPEWVNHYYYYYGKQTLKFNHNNENQFFDFKNLEMYAGTKSNTYIRHGDYKQTKDKPAWLTSSIFDSGKRSYHNYGLDISIKKVTNDHDVLLNDLDKKGVMNQSFIEKELINLFRNNEFGKMLATFSNVFYSYITQFISYILSKHNVANLLFSKEILLDFNKFELRENGEGKNWDNFIHFYDLFEFALKEGTISSLIKQMYSKVYLLNDKPFLGSDNIKNIFKFQSIENIENKKITSTIINLKETENNFFELIDKIEKSENVGVTENYQSLNKTIDKIKYFIKKQIKYAKDNTISFNASKNKYEDQLLDFLKNNKQLVLPESDKLKLVLLKTFIYHKENKFRFNIPYNNKTTFKDEEMLKKFKKEILEEGLIPECIYKVHGLDGLLRDNDITLPDDFLKFNNKEIILQNYYMLLDKLIQPSKNKVYYQKNNKYILLAANFFNLWKFKFDNNFYYFESENDVYEYIKRYVEINIKEIK